MKPLLNKDFRRVRIGADYGRGIGAGELRNTPQNWLNFQLSKRAREQTTCQPIFIYLFPRYLFINTHADSCYPYKRAKDK